LQIDRPSSSGLLILVEGFNLFSILKFPIRDF
jgi:hypothetical protein